MQEYRVIKKSGGNMLKNYILVVLRMMKKNKFYSFVSIFGLALGLSFFSLVLSFQNYENSYDDFHINKNEIFKVELHVYSDRTGDFYDRSMTGASLAPLLKSEFPQIKNTVRIANFLSSIVGTDEKLFKEKKFVFADADLFKVFTFKLAQGNQETALLEPFSVVLTRDCAKKYFGSQNPVGKTISYNNASYFGKKVYFNVTGVLDDIPSNSTLQFDFLASFATLNSEVKFIREGNSWDGPIWTYIQLGDAKDSQLLQSGFSSFVDKHIHSKDMDIRSLSLVLLKDTYYHRSDGIAAGNFGLKIITYFILFIAVVVLILASTNFASLLTAKSITRRKEIGIRKVHGAGRLKLILQFVGESVILSFFAFLLSIIITAFFVSSFQQFMGNAFPTMNLLPDRKIDIGIFNFKALFNLFSLSLLTGIIAGIYPAVISSKYKTADILKGEMHAGRHSAWFRKSLLVLQFAVSVIFINCSLDIIRFINSVENTDMGMNTKNIITVPVYDKTTSSKYSLLKDNLLKCGSVENVTSTDLLPAGIEHRILNLRNNSQNKCLAISFNTDTAFIKTMGLKILQGSDFNSNNFSDGILISKKIAKNLNLSNPVGERLELFIEEKSRDTVLFSGRVAGVYDDFKYSLTDKRDEGSVIRINPTNMSYILINVKEGKNPEALAALRNCWNDLDIKQPLEYSFLKDEINILSSIYTTIDTSIRFASFLSILIAALGLLAIASFIIDRKTKEIGIRKVMGGSIKDIITELTGSFVLLVVIANIIAIPVSYLILSNTIYNRSSVSFSIWTFTAATIASLLLAILIVGIKSYKAATVNPVIVLRSE